MIEIDYRFYELTYSQEGIDDHHFYDSYDAAWIAATIKVPVPKGCRIKKNKRWGVLEV